MKPETTGLELLLAAEQTLAREVAPHLSGDLRYKTLMAASAIRMVIRELKARAEAVGPVQRDNTVELAAAIRRGEYRDHGPIYRALLHNAEARTRVSNPAFPGLTQPLGSGRT